LFAVDCAKNPVSAPVEVTTTPTIVVLNPALAWWDMSDSLFYVQINKAEGGGVVADTASLWVTAYTIIESDTAVTVTAYKTEYFGYRSGDWSWCLEDSFCVYRPADSVKLELTYWIGNGPKSTLDMGTAVRIGAK
ncbi:MAG: hypothetical protein WC886_07935, partial [Saccharofermentanaceae bacterium]|jgi:hypothetical protein